MASGHEDLRIQLESVAEALADRAVACLRAAVEEGRAEGLRAPDVTEEKELRRARRSVEKAIQVLQRLDEGPAAGADPW